MPGGRADPVDPAPTWPPTIHPLSLGIGVPLRRPSAARRTGKTCVVTALNAPYVSAPSRLSRSVPIPSIDLSETLWHDS
jgi:hypothetical protein